MSSIIGCGSGEIFFVFAETVEEDGEEKRNADHGTKGESVGGAGDAETGKKENEENKFQEDGEKGKNGGSARIVHTLKNGGGHWRQSDKEQLDRKDLK